MSHEQQERIGEYVQFERKLYEQQGLGLGLTLSQKLVKIHKGKFNIKSELGKFTTITIKIPRLEIEPNEFPKLD